MIVFQTPGIIPLESFTVFGMSSKPNSHNPIGRFGTGLKYGVACALRLGGEVRLWRGEQEYVFYTKNKDFRGKKFETVKMKRRNAVWAPWRYESLPFTTELGKHWEPWMAIREFEANTRDEGGRSWIADDETPHGMSYLNVFAGAPDSTTLWVDCLELEKEYRNLDEIFLPEMEPIFENDKIRIYPGESDNIFYRGMRVTDLRKPSLYTYEMKHVWLTEDRTSQYPFIDNDNIRQSILSCDDKSIIDTVVENSEGHHEANLDWDKKPEKVSTYWSAALGVSGLSPRFSTLRDNLNYGLSRSASVDVGLTVSDWDKVLSTLSLAREEKLYSEIWDQLKEAGAKLPNLLSQESPELADYGGEFG